MWWQAENIFRITYAEKALIMFTYHNEAFFGNDRWSRSYLNIALSDGEQGWHLGELNTFDPKHFDGVIHLCQLEVILSELKRKHRLS